MRSENYPEEDIKRFTYIVKYINSSRNGELVEEALRAVEAQLSSLTPSVLSSCSLGPFDGEPDDFTIYLCLEPMIDKNTKASVEFITEVKRILEPELLKRDFTSEDLATYSYVFVSKKELDEAGNWYRYLS